MMSNNAALNRLPGRDAASLTGAAGHAAAEDIVAIATRFGTIGFDRRERIHMPRGMAGFPACREFGIARFPDPRLAHFLVLQSMDEPAVSFLLLPESCLGGAIASKHRAAAARDLGIAEADLAMAFVVTVRTVAGTPELSVNLRAPVLVDAQRRLAWQYVLPYGDYPIRRVVGRDVRAADTQA